MLKVKKTSTELAKLLARVAIDIRESTKLQISQEGEKTFLYQIFQKIDHIFFHKLSIDNFSDIYAQTITYGFFIIKILELEDFTPNKIDEMIMKTDPILQNIISKTLRISNDLTFKEELEHLSINNLFRILTNTNVESIINDFKSNKLKRDPIIHFYEDFLQYYNPKLKMKLGVFYTPRPIVSFIIKSVDQILKFEFNLRGGIGSNNLFSQILDPATGTGTFLSYIIEYVKSDFVLNHQNISKDEIKKNWTRYVNKYLLQKVFGFELMFIPFLIGQLKLILKLKTTEYDFSKSQPKINLFRKNTLEGNNLFKISLNHISQASRNSDNDKKNTNNKKIKKPILVVLGNPPYSGHSANNTSWIKGLLKGTVSDGTRRSNYFEVDGKPLGEKNPKFLQDDYVKFIRFAQWQIEKTGHGIVAYVTNHSFLDNPTFRGMREQLMKAFTSIYILDLHGNARRKERCPDGSKDENVFDIQQGVCISFFIKNPNKRKGVKIYREDLWGLRQKKYCFLENNDITTINWKEINAFSPWYMFYQLDMKRWNEYQSWWKIPDVFSFHSVGIMTGQDSLTIQDEPQKVLKLIEDIILLPEIEVRSKYSIKKDKRQWTFQKAKLDLEDCGLNISMNRNELKKRIQDNLFTILYRPFDKRYTFFTGRSRGFHERPRGKVMKHMIHGENLGLIISRNSRPSPWRDVLITENIIELGIMATRPGNNAPIFPLYLFERTNSGFQRNNNLSPEFKRFIKEEYKTDNRPTPTDIFYYIYAILHSKQYRENYASFLKIDFPRVPFTFNMKLFKKLKEIGKKLIELHLMRSEKIKQHQIRLKDNFDEITPIVTKVQYTSDNKLKINDKQYFEGVPRDVYDFYIGGYQVCRKWLKDHKGKELTNNEIDFFGKIVKIIQETLQLMEIIDLQIQRNGSWPNAFISSTDKSILIES